MERAFLTELQGRVLELKRQATSVEEAERMLAAEFKAKYPDWANLGVLPNAVRRMYAESQ